MNTVNPLAREAVDDKLSSSCTLLQHRRVRGGFSAALMETFADTHFSNNGSKEYFFFFFYGVLCKTIVLIFPDCFRLIKILWKNKEHFCKSLLFLKPHHVQIEVGECICEYSIPMPSSPAYSPVFSCCCCIRNSSSGCMSLNTGWWDVVIKSLKGQHCPSIELKISFLSEAAAISFFFSTDMFDNYSKGVRGGLCVWKQNCSISEQAAVISLFFCFSPSPNRASQMMRK